MMDKSELRTVMSRIRSEIPEEKRKESSIQIAENIISLDAFINSKSIFTYISFRDEPDTSGIIAAAKKLGKFTAAPRMLPGKMMEFYAFEDLADLVPNRLGILEPSGNEPLVPDKTLMIIPGLAFDKNMNRLGYGGGYYDRYFARFKGSELIKAAICFDEQIAENIMADVYDVPMDLIITPTKVISNK